MQNKHISTKASAPVFKPNVCIVFEAQYECMMYKLVQWEGEAYLCDWRPAQLAPAPARNTGSPCSSQVPSMSTHMYTHGMNTHTLSVWPLKYYAFIFHF